jgi:hypothetical protein
MKAKIVQITHFQQHGLAALTEDGSVYSYYSGEDAWKKLPDITIPDQEPKVDAVDVEQKTRWLNNWCRDHMYWEISTGKPTPTGLTMAMEAWNDAKLDDTTSGKFEGFPRQRKR